MKGLSPMELPTTPQSRPQRVKGQYPSPVPYNTTRPSSHPATPVHQRHSTSVPPSPYTSLTEKQIKKLQKVFEKTDSKVQFARELLELAGLEFTKENVIELVAR